MKKRSVLIILCLFLMTSLSNAIIAEEYSVGNVIEYGTYVQASEGTESTPIQWFVLTKTDEATLLISCCAIDAQIYNTENSTWQDSALRHWMNNDFLNNAFTAEQQDLILSTAVDNSAVQGKADWQPDDQPATEDKIFALSYSEFEKYIKDTEMAACDASEYATAKGVHTYWKYFTGAYWWLRSPGEEPGMAAVVNYIGDVFSSENMDSSFVGARPAMWVSLSDNNMLKQGAVEAHDPVNDIDFSAINDNAINFPNSSEYTTLLTSVANTFGDLPYHYKYDSNTRTFTIYYSGSQKQRTAIVDNISAYSTAINDLANSIKELSGKWGTYVDLSTRGGIMDYNNGHCQIYFVDQLNDIDQYTRSDDIIIQTYDNEIRFNLVTAVNKGEVKPSQNTPDTTGISHATTAGERNALQSAKDYLNVIAFSRKGLIEQLEYEGYSYSEAVYAVDHCGADWYDQARKCAKQYLDIMSFSKTELIEQLEYDGFTNSEAVYGASNSY